MARLDVSNGFGQPRRDRYSENAGSFGAGPIDDERAGRGTPPPVTNRPSVTPRLFLLARVAVIVAIAWGALAFGAVYPWAYWPLTILAALGASLAVAAAGRVAVPQRWLLAGIMLFAGAVGFQMVPLSTQVLTTWTPLTVSALRRMDLGFAFGMEPRHALSLNPTLTRAGLAIFLSCAVLTIGVARLCSAYGVKWLTSSVTLLGVVMALAGIIQKPLYAGKIYGFWAPLEGGNPFGPFVNRNHFAGWMMMALPLTLGAICAGVDKGMRGVKPVWRERFLWFGSKSASQLIMLGAGAAIMGLSLVLTMSRSGIAAFGLAVALTGAFVVLGVTRGARRTVGTVYLAALFALVIGWVGVDVIASRFEQTNWEDYNDRRGPWQDARDIAAMFPLTGTGFGTYGVATSLYQKHDVEQHFEQAHNDYLQLAAEGGVLLTVPAAFLALVIAFHTWSRFRDGTGSVTSWWVRAGAVTGLIALASQEVVDFSLQMPGNAVLCAVLIGVALHRSPMPVTRRAKAKEGMA